mmetsp:Transcript_29643/g.64512  ORF Transcript_29643/g.64512 Transcript_29643/m.64512 type:complete len:642 (+) Transcript_29643:67-1992(+)|eukprot:CAMPEP_0170581634 /NCGR_PEP_ID=MMETSP0224-20130122/7146_1 /TAXON_ID=285029 /ORGANISM="Togula jolla, Strain CCCM 725" /LENGTH=641 /DNA_ID=CAMNT_0010904787 /DNA_START=62 /DNA_END=1987 /DNA_ORIENTATION=-
MSADLEDGQASGGDTDGAEAPYLPPVERAPMQLSDVDTLPEVVLHVGQEEEASPLQDAEPNLALPVAVQRGEPTGFESASPTERGAAEVALQFACPICLELCEDAVETPCCHNLFCKYCLLSRDHFIQNCPICKSHLKDGSVRANVPVRRLISDLPSTCRFDGCGTELRRRDQAKHEASCEFAPVRCRYSVECEAMPRGKMTEHEELECPHRPVECPLGCGLHAPHMRLEEHLERDCPLVMCTCEYCQVPICRAELDGHVAALCPLAPAICNYAEEETQACCGHGCERRLLLEHQKTCPFRPASCRHEGCVYVTTVRLQELHEAACQWRLIPCPDCSFEVCVGLLQQHFDSDCLEHVVPCPFSAHGCPELLPRRLVAEHIEAACGNHLAQLCCAVARRDLQIDALKLELSRAHSEMEQRLVRLETSYERRNVSLPSLTSPSDSGTSALPNLPPPPPPPPAMLLRRASGVPLDAGLGARPELPRSSDMYPGPARDRDLGVSPPATRQPLALLRDGGVSQVPVLGPPRMLPGATLLSVRDHSRLGHGLSSGVGYRPPHSPTAVPPPRTPAVHAPFGLASHEPSSQGLHSHSSLLGGDGANDHTQGRLHSSRNTSPGIALPPPPASSHTALLSVSESEELSVEL